MKNHEPQVQLQQFASSFFSAINATTPDCAAIAGARTTFNWQTGDA
jgi:hypothetical protein